MFAALRSAVRADIDQQIGWAKDQLKRRDGHVDHRTISVMHCQTDHGGGIA